MIELYEIIKIICCFHYWLILARVEEGMHTEDDDKKICKERE